MKLGIVSDSLGQLSLTDVLDHAQRLGVDGIELNTGGWSSAPHVDVAQLLGSNDARRAFLAEFAARDLALLALNANGNPLHPTDRAQADCVVDTLRLAGELGVTKVCTMSGLPGGGPNDQFPNWVVTNCPPETETILRYQWDECLLPFWTGITMLARDSGVDQIALHLHGNQCVYNVPTLMSLREEIGPLIGANLDPSQLLWMGADPQMAAFALGEAIYHVHAKDIVTNPQAQALTSCLDTGSSMDGPSRAWSYTTPGAGHGADWWQRFFHRLRVAGYDGDICVLQNDPVLAPTEGLERTLGLLQNTVPRLPIEQGAAPV